LYVAEIRNQKIRKITPSGVVTTLAGSGTIGSADGTGAAASFNSPSDVSVDSGGNVYVADRDNQKIRKITSVGVVTTLAGNGTTGAADGTGAVASFTSPSGVSVDAGGNVYVADAGNNRIRKITVASYVINPTLVAGLNFDNTTGIISGTPTVSSAATSYTITAYNTTGSSSTTVVIATTTLGTTIFNKQELKLYPNPVTALLHIQTPNNIILDKVRIVDLTGKKVLEQTQNTSQVDVAHLANGMYIIEAFSGQEKFSSKFMKE
jgi:sugar lactone lactonase YvrE